MNDQRQRQKARLSGAILTTLGVAFALAVMPKPEETPNTAPKIAVPARVAASAPEPIK